MTDNTDNLSDAGREILLAGRAQLSVAMPYLSGPLCALVPLPGDDVTTSAATDGENLCYNAAFLASGFMKSERFSPRLTWPSAGDGMRPSGIWPAMPPSRASSTPCPMPALPSVRLRRSSFS